MPDPTQNAQPLAAAPRPTPHPGAHADRADAASAPASPRPDGARAPGEAIEAALPLTNAELVQLQIRVIALENLVITLLAEASDRQRALASDIADCITPQPGTRPHRLTLHAAARMNELVERANRFRLASSTDDAAATRPACHKLRERTATPPGAAIDSSQKGL